MESSDIVQRRYKSSSPSLKVISGIVKYGRDVVVVVTVDVVIVVSGRVAEIVDWLIDVDVVEVDVDDGNVVDEAGEVVVCEEVVDVDREIVGCGEDETVDGDVIVDTVVGDEDDDGTDGEVLVCGKDEVDGSVEMNVVDDGCVFDVKSVGIPDLLDVSGCVAGLVDEACGAEITTNNSLYSLYISVNRNQKNVMILF